MKKFLFLLALMFLIATNAPAQFSFHLIDNFEDNNYTQGPKWWHFDNLVISVVANPSTEARDLIAESCGDYALKMSGRTNNWYVGGMGTDLGVDGSHYSRFQLDLYGNEDRKGKLKIELFDDDNFNYSIEQDPKNNYEPVFDDKWVAEINILGQGFTRISIPFSAFHDANPGVGDDIWNPTRRDGSGGLLKLQLVGISGDQNGKIDFKIDNILLTY